MAFSPPFILHVYLLDYPITRIRHCHFTELEDSASNYVSSYQAVRMAEEVCRADLLQVGSQAMHLDDWNSFQALPHFYVIA
jgi:hypothetical protein